MPQINLIPEVLYEPSQPYHYLYDNLPLKNILARISLVNIQTDNNANMLLGTAGSTGSLANRLDVSIEEDGSLNPEAVDASLHNIAYHTDGADEVGVEYVRMLAEERSKLSLIQSGANLLTIEVGEEGVIENGSVEFRNSDSVEFRLQAPNIIRAYSSIPSYSAHRHMYNVEPAHQDPVPDWRSFITTSVGTPYMEGSLRVYVNGVRLGDGTYAPIFSGSSTPSSWVLFSVSSENHLTGEFELNSSVPQPGNRVLIDFDISLSSPNESSSSSSNPGSSSSSSGLTW